MIQLLKGGFNTEDKKRLLSNFFSLSVLQGANYILPLITLPYLVRVLGPEKFGLIMFAQAFIQYFVILTDYGFNLSATREISIHRDNKEKISEIFSSVMFIKFVLFILALLIMTVIVFSFEKFKKEWLIYYLTFGMVLGQTLFPVWFFQGMERMKYITFLNITAKLIFTVSIFIFIHQVSDYIYVPLINSLGFLVAGVLGIFLIFNNFKLYFIFDIQKSFELFKNSFSIFIGIFANNIVYFSLPFLIGLFSNNIMVGYFSAADKLIKAILGMVYPIAQTIYPFYSKKLSELYRINEKKSIIIKYMKSSLIIMLIFLVFSVLIFSLSDKIILILYGEDYIKSSMILKILIFSIPLHAFLHIFLTQTILNLNLYKFYSIGYLLTLIIGFILFLLFLEKLDILILSALTYNLYELLLIIFFSFTIFIFLKEKS